MPSRPYSHAQAIQTRYYHRQISVGTNHSDPFSVDPVRRSAAVVLICVGIVLSTIVAGGELGTAILLTVGWLAVIGLIFCVPILIWSAAEQALAFARRRLHPPIEALGLSPRLVHILHRHGLDSIVAVERTPDGQLMSFSNLDGRDLEQIRRTIRLWRYARWQEKGFPASGAP